MRRLRDRILFAVTASAAMWYFGRSSNEAAR